MEEIQNFNCFNLCAEKSCNEPYEFFDEISLNGIKVFIALCKTHAKIWEETKFKNEVCK